MNKEDTYVDERDIVSNDQYGVLISENMVEQLEKIKKELEQKLKRIPNVKSNYFVLRICNLVAVCGIIGAALLLLFGASSVTAMMFMFVACSFAYIIWLGDIGYRMGAESDKRAIESDLERIEKLLKIKKGELYILKDEKTKSQKIEDLKDERTIVQKIEDLNLEQIKALKETLRSFCEEDDIDKKTSHGCASTSTEEKGFTLSKKR